MRREGALNKRASTALGQIATVAQGLVTSGRGAGARPGDWPLQVVESANIKDDSLVTHELRSTSVEQNAKTEKHLLTPNDLLITGRSTTIKVAMVPPGLSRTVAASTLLVVRPLRPELGVTPLLWYYFTSTQGRAQLQARLVASVTIAALPASSLLDIEVPLPPARELRLLADFIEQSELAHAAGLEALEAQRVDLRDAVIARLQGTATTHKEGRSWH